MDRHLAQGWTWDTSGAGDRTLRITELRTCLSPALFLDTQGAGLHFCLTVDMQVHEASHTLGLWRITDPQTQSRAQGEADWSPQTRWVKVPQLPGPPGRVVGGSRPHPQPRGEVESSGRRPRVQKGVRTDGASRVLAFWTRLCRWALCDSEGGVPLLWALRVSPVRGMKGPLAKGVVAGSGGAHGRRAELTPSPRANLLQMKGSSSGLSARPAAVPCSPARCPLVFTLGPATMGRWPDRAFTLL